VSVGISADTAEFSVAALRCWRRKLGRQRYPQLTRILITADRGGSNGARNRLWKWELPRRADEWNVIREVYHFPPGTSKWNKVEHQLFCHITSNWRGKPLTDHQVVVSLLGSTTTSTGLVVHAQLDRHQYSKVARSVRPSWKRSTSSHTVSTVKGTTKSTRAANQKNDKLFWRGS
jgi:hypothetical protein